MQTKYQMVIFLVLLLIASNSNSAQLVEHADVVAALSQNHAVIQMGKLPTGHDVAEAIINGQTGLFVVDTAAITAINQRLTDKYKLSKKEKLQSQNAAGAGTAIMIDSYALDSMRFGALNVPLEQIGVTDLNAVTQGLYSVSGRQIDGLIGQDVLLSMHAVIDVSNHNLYLRNAGGLVSEDNRTSPKHVLSSNSGLQTIGLDFLEFKNFAVKFLTAPIKINGIEGVFIIDSGAGSSMLNSQSLKKFGLDTATTTGSRTSSGAGGAFTIQSIDISAFAIRHLDIKKSNIGHMNMSAAVNFVASQTGLHVDGVLGQDILIKHKAIIDVAGHTLYLRQ
jgi:predicted aspartyl protease